MITVPPFLVRKVFIQTLSCAIVQQYVGSSWDELKHIRQSIGFLVIHQNPKKTLDEISHDLCPVLSIQHLYRISTMYWDDKYGTHSLSPEVVSQREGVNDRRFKRRCQQFLLAG